MTLRGFLKSIVTGVSAIPFLSFSGRRNYLTVCPKDKVVGLKLEAECLGDELHGDMQVTSQCCRGFYYKGQFIHNNWMNKWYVQPIGKNEPVLLIVLLPPRTTEGDDWQYGMVDLTKGKFFV